MLKLVSFQNKDILLDFELDNKKWFEQFVPARNASYLTPNGINEAIKVLVDEMTAGEGAYYLVFADDKVIGRINFSRININSAELGFRIAKNFTGNNIAAKMIKQLLPKVKESLEITVVIAQTSCNNPASIRTLEKCGFQETGIKKAAVKLHGESLDLVQFEHG
ncbi:MAG: GNAT family N-acetyltransferase [Devosiaceae bacterium]|nr:GNAT family N-acetyltransferase [Devosiaceae bacterium]